MQIRTCILQVRGAVRPIGTKMPGIHDCLLKRRSEEKTKKTGSFFKSPPFLLNVRPQINTAFSAI
ncbi:hypothetical protein CHCC15087_3797 [Bacillus licheniformis]|nr:hypothetical protein CHCC15087_3797 [Bacillus licheniformis]